MSIFLLFHDWIWDLRPLLEHSSVQNLIIPTWFQVLWSRGSALRPNRRYQTLAVSKFGQHTRWVAFQPLLLGFFSIHSNHRVQALSLGLGLWLRSISCYLSHLNHKASFASRSLDGRGYRNDQSPHCRCSTLWNLMVIWLLCRIQSRLALNTRVLQPSH